MPETQQQWIVMLVSFGLLALVLTLRMRRIQVARPLRVERLWLMPAFFAAIVAALYWSHPPQGRVWLFAAGALLVGGLLGWWRGKLMHIVVDPKTHEVSQQGSAAAMIFILLLVGLRYAARSAIIATDAGPQGTIVATDILLAMGLGFISMQRFEMGLRARRMIEAARAGRDA